MKLRTLFLSVLGLFCLNFTHGQTFSAKDTTDLLPHDFIGLEWLDLNLDQRYDLIVYGTEKDSTFSKIEVYLNGGDGTFADTIRTDLNVLLREVQFIDYNRDSLTDIVFTGITPASDTVLSVLFGLEDFTFEAALTPLMEEDIVTFEVFDLNYDTRPDLLIGERNEQDSIEFEIYRGTATGFESEDLEFPKFDEVNTYLIDLNSDGLRDLILSGSTLSEGSTFTYLNQRNLEFEPSNFLRELENHEIKNLTVGEFDSNGFPDFFISSEDASDEERNVIYSSAGDSLLVLKEILEDFEADESLMADFNSDGRTDLRLSVEKEDSVFSYFYYDINNPADSLLTYRDSLVSTHFADFNGDGNLDYAELQEGASDSLKIILFENDLPGVNFGPVPPAPSVAVQTGPGRLKVSWQPARDSLTDNQSISYDALVTDADTTELFEASMNTVNFWPTRPMHGNQLYADELVLDSLAPGDYFFCVLGIDNAFNYRAGGSGGDELVLGKVAICGEDPIVSNVEMCDGSYEEFGTPGVERNWYSDRLGAIGTGVFLTYTAGSVDDVIYGTVQNFQQCDAGQLVINVSILDGPNEIPIDAFTRVCGPQEIAFELPEEWSEVTWRTSLLGAVGTQNSLTLDITQSDTLFVEATNNVGCKYRAQSVIGFVDFRPAVQDTLHTISVGESVRLSASGGTRYVWGPPETLDNPFSATPLASPRETTDYSVIIQNNEGCVERLSVRVEVEQVGAAANLFSPNGDNRNDTFFLQLSSAPALVDFRIYTREGNLVYQESNGNRVINAGWDGTHNGKKMPPGVYYWRIKGFYSDGKPVTVNGENSGKVHLIR